MAIDKNPRQITRLRVEDQKKLEELATELTYNSTTNTFEIGTNLYVDGNITSEEYYFHPGNDGDYKIGCNYDTNEILFYNSIDGYINHLDLSNDGNILKDTNVKTIFGKSIRKDPEQPGDNNIDLYNHIISIDINSTILLNIFVKASSSNLKVNSLNDLTTLLNAKENTIIECNAYNSGQTYTRNVDITGLIYTNSTWKYGMVYMTPQGPFIDNEALITTATINDVVTPL